jgi:predicted transcriptional regulator
MSAKAPTVRYRSKGRIFADILRVVKQEGSAKPTHILYKANLSHDRLTKYLSLLEESQLLIKEVEGEKTEYSITAKGERFLVEFRRMEQFADAFGLEI